MTYIRNLRESTVIQHKYYKNNGNNSIFRKGIKAVKSIYPAISCQSQYIALSNIYKTLSTLLYTFQSGQIPHVDAPQTSIVFTAEIKTKKTPYKPLSLLQSAMYLPCPTHSILSSLSRSWSTLKFCRRDTNACEIISEVDTGAFWTMKR